MICKECGAYNPDHATYCKVCAANLKGAPEAETTEAPVEDPQPTKRFSRPSWVVPEQTKAAAETIEEAVSEAELPTEETAELFEQPEEPKPLKKQAKPVRKEREPEPAESNDEFDDDDPDAYEVRSDRPIWTPTRSNRRTRILEENDDEDEDDNVRTESAEDKHESDEDGIYNDEEALDQDDDSFEYEPTPPKRKSAKKKNNTLFTILLIAIIVVIVCILVAGGLFFLTKSGVLKCGGDSGASMLNCSGAQKTNTDPEATEAPSAEETQNPSASSEEEHPSEKTATLLEYVDDSGEERVAITVLVPAHGAMTIELPHQDDYHYESDYDVARERSVKIPVAAFYPHTPLDSPTLTIQPNVTVTTADGNTYPVECPSFTKNRPQVSISLTSPTAKDDGKIMAAEGNVIHLEGKVDDPSVELKINGVKTPVYEGGVFMQDYTLSGDASETLELVATKMDCVSASTSITVDPYVFVPDPMLLEVKDDIASLRADKSGKLTVTGKTLPGATLTATSDDTTQVLCGSVTVDAEGNFSFQVTMDSAFYGISTITLNGTKEGAEDGSTTFIVTKAHADKEAFTKFYNKTKRYLEIPKHITISEILASVDTYNGNEYGFRVSATVNEIINDGDKTIVKMTLLKTNEVVYVWNLSSKWTPQDNIGGKYNVYGNFIGTYQDTGCCAFIGWFGKVIK